MQDKLRKIIEFTDHAHGEQMRRYSPQRYIVHPVNVMETCRKYSNDISVLAAALMHDILEDTPVDEAEIKSFIQTVMNESECEKTISIVKELTDVYVKKEFPKLNRRTRKQKELLRLEKISPDAQTIKYADIIDNINGIAEDDPDFADVYLRECRQIVRKLDLGNGELRNEALSKIESLLRKS